jgi:hypothetical protein
MKPVTTFSLTVVLSSVLAAPGFAAISGEQAHAQSSGTIEPDHYTVVLDHEFTEHAEP